MKFLLPVLTLLVAPLAADVRVPRVLSDHMVLQRGQPAPVWGSADPGEPVVVEFAGQELATEADGSGRWRVELAPLEASAEGRVLRVRGAANRIELEDVVVGDVWLCSGQSNMVWRVQGSARAEEFTAAATDGRVRMFTGQLVSAPEPREDLPGAWLAASPETVGRFSAVAYHFGRGLVAELDVPVGLVNVSWGGSNVEAWSTLEALGSTAPGRAALQKLRRYEAELEPPIALATPGYDDSEWDPVLLPALFADLGHDADGVYWFRRRIELPPSWRGRELVLDLGPVDDEDHLFVDGRLLGNTVGWKEERSYRLAGEHTAVESLLLALRVRNGSGPGGLHAEPADLRVHPAGQPGEARSLAGTWRARLTASVGPAGEQHRPAFLYNGMLHPLRHLALRGALWYQGENNAMGEPARDYRQLLPAFLGGLRATFRRPDLPVGIVQLPAFGENDSPLWRFHHVRDAQLRTWQELPGLGLAVTLDLGEADDIHPRNKHDVGDRLARWALHAVHGRQDVVPMGPVPRSFTVVGDEVRVELETFGAGLATRDGGAPGGFLVAGEDRVFHPARTRIEGEAVIASSPEVPAPVAVRHAWANDPADANLVGGTGLPASPFRSDDWELP